jgi:hypothetical protein
MIKHALGTGIATVFLVVGCATLAEPTPSSGTAPLRPQAPPTGTTVVTVNRQSADSGPAAVVVTEGTFMVRLTGTPGTGFEGSYKADRAGGPAETKGVVGELPATFEAKGVALSASFQKTGDGDLTLEIFKDGQVVARKTAPAGQSVVRAATP